MRFNERTLGRKYRHLQRSRAPFIAHTETGGTSAKKRAKGTWKDQTHTSRGKSREASAKEYQKLELVADIGEQEGVRDARERAGCQKVVVVGHEKAGEVQREQPELPLVVRARCELLFKACGKQPASHVSSRLHTASCQPWRGHHFEAREVDE
eukprot:116508-Rhodomonas_salina.1